jgi:surface protein
MFDMFNRAYAFNQDISNWDVYKVNNMTTMFYYASEFNQDLSSWKVPLIASKPTQFDSLANNWVKTDRQPQWGVV